MERPGEERAGLNEATLGESGMPGSRMGSPGMRAAEPASAGMVEGGAGAGDQESGPARVARGEAPPAEAARGTAAAAGDAAVVPGGAAATPTASGDGEAAGVAALEERLERFRERFARARREIERVVVGQQQVVSEVLWALLAGGHVLVEGVPGLGKTALVRALGRVLGLRFSRIQFTPDLMPGDLLGSSILEEQPGGRRGWRWEPGPIWANLVLADEVNRATPKTQCALLEAMA